MSNKIFKLFCGCLVGCAVSATTSCSDFFEQESDHVMFDDYNHLSNASDTIYSVTGIMKKLQALADRTILLGEARGDLVDITDATSADLRSVALFNVGDSNQYNQPRDYYAVINNCNYFLAHVDTTIRNSRDEQIFLNEMATVKAYRAWTYLQLAINYGRVPFITEPIMTKEQAEQLETGHHQDLQSICEWLISDLDSLTKLSYLRYDPYYGNGDGRWIDMGENPIYGDIGYRTNSKFFYFPISLLLGELNLWAGHDLEAARWYYRYLSTRNGNGGTYTTGLDRMAWGNSNWTAISQPSGYYSSLINETYSPTSELITMIPGDSIPYNGNYLQLRNIFNSTDPVSGEYHDVSLTPSRALLDLSASQVYCYVQDYEPVYAPADAGWQELHHGDLRLYGTYSTNYTYHNGERVSTQTIHKYSSRNAHLWRRQMVWLHMAEALNRAGYPRFAYQILARGISDNVLENYVIPYYADSTLIRQEFSFPNTRYGYANPQGLGAVQNMQGIHSRGSGWAYMNDYYQFPDDTLLTDPAARLAYQQRGVEQMIIDEGALELAFEGQRYYDLLRFALRNGDPAVLADRVYGRKGEAYRSALRQEIKLDLYNLDNLFLKWNGKVGIDVQ